MKKIIIAISLIFLSVLFISCEFGDKMKKESDTTVVKIKNMSQFHIQLYLGSNQQLSKDGLKDVPSGSEVQFSAADSLSEGLTYIFCQIVRSDNLAIGGEPIICRISEPLTIKKNETSTFQITDNTIVVDSMDSSNKGTVATLITSTVLTVKNSSSFDLEAVTYKGTEFSSNPMEPVLEKGAEKRLAVESGYGYISFTRKTDGAKLRSKDVINIQGRGKSGIYEFKDDTEVVELNNETNTGELKEIKKYVVFHDGADGKVYPYTSRSRTAYYISNSEDPDYATRGNYICMYGQESVYLENIGSAAKLELEIDLEKDAVFSFWYASSKKQSYLKSYKVDVDLWINGHLKHSFDASSYEWSKYSMTLPAGENTIEFDGSLNDYMQDFYLDDLLIVYTE